MWMHEMILCMVLGSTFWKYYSFCIGNEVDKGVFHHVDVAKYNICIMGDSLLGIGKWKHFG